MLRYVAKQLLNMAVTLLVVSFLVFALNELTPGDVARKLLGPYATQDQVEYSTEQDGARSPSSWSATCEYLANALRGDFGNSHRSISEPVAEVVWDRLGNTLLLAAICFAVIVPFSVLLGVLAGMRERSVLDRAISVFSLDLRLDPRIRARRVPAGDLRRLARLAARHLAAQHRAAAGRSGTQLVLPVAVVVLYDVGYLIAHDPRLDGRGDAPALHPHRDAEGHAFRDVVVKHALRNAMIAPFTVILLQINYLVAGVVVVETVFAYPGFGRMMLEAALPRTSPLVEAGTLVAVLRRPCSPRSSATSATCCSTRGSGMTQTGQTVPDGTAADASPSRSAAGRGTLARVWVGPVAAISPSASLGVVIIAVLGRCARCWRPGSRPIRRTQLDLAGAGRPVRPSARALARHRPSRPRHPLAHHLGRAHRADRRADRRARRLVVGTLLGLLAGYRGGWIDTILMRVGDIILAFPVIILYIIIIATFGASASTSSLVDHAHHGARSSPASCAA